MISYVKGKLADISEGSIVIDVSGIGWQVFVPGQVLDRLPALGETVKIHTWLQVREDAMTLFGFLSKDDLQIFKLLIGVNGIGPKNALAILSVMTTDDLRFAVLGDDAKAIARTPGVGTKTAQRLILELKDKVSLEDAFEQKLANVQEAQAEASGVKAEAVMALTALGYSSSEALKTLSGIEVTEDMDVETVLKQALKKMAMI
ncbi:MAG: Holliday junction branch migration protein RuvA [Eubacterium sp.]|nr:Holliday junction branch migration protein RuvA [Eubacterium sp.]